MRSLRQLSGFLLGAILATLLASSVPSLAILARDAGEVLFGGTGAGDDLTILGTTGALQHESSSNPSLVDARPAE